MTYTFKGRFCGSICSECPEPLSNVKVRLYRHREGQNVTALAVANPKDTSVILSEEMAAEKASLLIAEAETDENGNFSFELGEEQNYEGEAFEVDVYLETVPGHKSKTETQPLQFSITTLQPQWRQAETGYIAVWDYCLPYRLWCAIRGLFGAWVICGRVVTCETQVPVPGVKVSAFDTDWIQDDELGDAVTDGAGKFRIDYTTADFQKTPFLGINIEQVGGPDLFFKVEDAGGFPLLEEPRSRGRDPDRENAGPCFCVELCVPIDEEPDEGYNPRFTHVGDFHRIADINAITGLTNKAVLGHGGPNFGFFGKLKLGGFCPKTAPGDPSKPMRYRFLYVHPDDPSKEKPITGPLVADVIVGYRSIKNWDINDGAGPVTTIFQKIIISASGATPDPTQPPYLPGDLPDPHVIEPDSDGWIKVDQKSLDGGFYGPLIKFKSAVAVQDGPLSDSGAGQPVSAADQKNGVALKLIFEAEPVTGGAPTFREELPKILINNWDEVRLLDLKQFHEPGADSCTPLTNKLNILYTTDHELMRNWDVKITTAASGVVMPTLPSGTGPRGGNGDEFVDISTWPSCSYLVWLTTRRALTNGEIDDSGKDKPPVSFCK